MLLQPPCDLCRPQSVNAEREHLLHNGGGFLVHDPLLFVLRVFHIPVGCVCAKTLAGFTLGLPCGTDFLAGVPCVHFAKHIADCGKLVLAPCAVYAVVDGDKVNAEVGKESIRIHPHLQIVAPEAAHVLYDNALDLALLDVGKHPLEARAVEVRPGIPVVLVVVPERRVAVFFAVAFQNLLLRRDLSRVISAKAFIGNIQGD